MRFAHLFLLPASSAFQTQFAPAAAAPLAAKAICALVLTALHIRLRHIHQTRNPSNSLIRHDLMYIDHIFTVTEPNARFQ